MPNSTENQKWWRSWLVKCRVQLQYHMQVVTDQLVRFTKTHLHSVLWLLSLCKHVHLSCVFLTKLTYLLTDECSIINYTDLTSKTARQNVATNWEAVALQTHTQDKQQWLKIHKLLWLLNSDTNNLTRNLTYRQFKNKYQTTHSRQTVYLCHSVLSINLTLIFNHDLQKFTPLFFGLFQQSTLWKSTH